MTHPAFGPAARDALAAAYPEQPVLLSHGLADHPLLQLDALAALASRMRPSDARCFRGDVPTGVGRRNVPASGLTPQETIEAIEKRGSWMVLTFLEQDPLYRALLDELLEELAPVVQPLTGPMVQRQSYAFVSSPGAVTPFHFDPEHNILLQLRGEKVMYIFPAGDERFVPREVHEEFHHAGCNNLDWDESFAPSAFVAPLRPGDGVYVPVKAPHWVQNGADAPSISFSITWRSGWSAREGYAHGMNRLLRRAGMNPLAPRRFPADNHAKALAFRGIQKVRRLVP